MNPLRWLKAEWELFCTFVADVGALEVCEDCDGMGLRVGKGGAQRICLSCDGDGWVKP